MSFLETLGYVAFNFILGISLGVGAWFISYPKRPIVVVGWWLVLGMAVIVIACLWIDASSFATAVLSPIVIILVIFLLWLVANNIELTCDERGLVQPPFLKLRSFSFSTMGSTSLTKEIRSLNVTWDRSLIKPSNLIEKILLLPLLLFFLPGTWGGILGFFSLVPLYYYGFAYLFSFFHNLGEAIIAININAEPFTIAGVLARVREDWEFEVSFTMSYVCIHLFISRH